VVQSLGLFQVNSAIMEIIMFTFDAGTVGLLTAVFIASAVECVEAFTIVLAMGLTRGWKSTIVGAVLALVALGLVVAIAGVSIGTVISQSLLKLIVGSLLLVFGLQWLRKSILRSSGLKEMHDQTSIFRQEQENARKSGEEERLGLDWFAFVVSFKGVFLEGLEVVFIVITFGLSTSAKNPHSILVASMGAMAASVVVLIAGIIAKGPLSSVPENTLKFAVGVLLCTFGTFWGTEGLGFFAPTQASLEWPGDDWALLVILVTWVVMSITCVHLLRKTTNEGMGAAG
jgi:Ca2+/H+ antiporter, TMEM165/GDT1 family